MLSVFDLVSLQDIFPSKGCTKVLKKFKVLKTCFVNQCFTLRNSLRHMPSAKSEHCCSFHKRFQYVCLCPPLSEGSTQMVIAECKKFFRNISFFYQCWSNFQKPDAHDSVDRSNLDLQHTV